MFIGAVKPAFGVSFLQRVQEPDEVGFVTLAKPKISDNACLKVGSNFWGRPARHAKAQLLRWACRTYPENVTGVVKVNHQFDAPEHAIVPVAPADFRCAAW